MSPRSPRNISIRQPSLIIVGKAPAFLEPLKKDFPDVKVIPVPEFGFESRRSDEGETLDSH